MTKHRVLFAVFMASINASIISFTLTAYNIGFPDNFLSKWGANFLIAFVLVVLSIIFLGPQVNKFIEKITK